MSPTLDGKKLLRVPEAAEVLRVAPGTLRNWRVQGFGPRFVKMGSRVMYSQASIDAFIQSRERAATDDRSKRAP